MAARKLQQEMEKTFKKVSEGRETFQQIYDKIQDCDNPSQKEKLEDQLKREIKKLQRHRDQIKTWAASNEIKDKKPLLEQRKLIETEMEKFKAVEKEMKTKAFSKEGLQQSAKLDPKEREKAEAGEFLSEQIEDLGRQIETLEAEEESLNVTVKKGKKDISRQDRLGEISKLIERHRWHQSQLELANRALENGSLETEQINNIKDDIKYYVQENTAVEFIEDDTIYDELGLDEDGGAWAATGEVDRVPSHDEDVIVETTEPVATAASKVKGKSSGAGSESAAPPGRRSSNNFRSPLPSLATLHAPSASTASTSSSSAMKPAPPPARQPGETLQYASAAKVAAASEKTITPLPPPPLAGISPSISALPAAPSSKAASVASPLPSTVTPIPPAAQPAPKSGQQPGSSILAASSIPPTPVLEKSDAATPPPKSKSPMPKKTARQQQQATAAAAAAVAAAAASLSATSTIASVASAPSAASVASAPIPLPTAPSTTSPEPDQPKTPPAPEHDARPRIVGGSELLGSGVGGSEEHEGEESIFHLPPGLQELISSFEMTRRIPSDPASETVQRMLAVGGRSLPDAVDTEKPRAYKPAHKYSTPRYYPQEPLQIVDDPGLFNRIDTDTLFFLFYYRQGSYLQYAAARALKQQSWRFHKQYQTWFQRHEEPKLISDEFEQGTYRFFDYESTWMNRRKADFKFAYKFLEDDL